MFVLDSVEQKSVEFICVRAPQKLANKFKINGAPVAVVVDPDGVELVRQQVRDEASLTAAWEAALKRYANRPIRWSNEIPKAAGSKPLLVVGFDDEKGQSLQVLEDRMLVKYHEKCQFVKLPYEKGGELARKWGVTSVPMIFLCDATKGDPEKSPLEKLAGRRPAPALREAIQRALLKIEHRKK